MCEHILWYRKPAKSWVESLPIGNGRMGAMLNCDPADEIIWLNHETLWSGYPRDYHNENAAKYLATVRELIRAGKESAAEKVMEEHMTGKFNESFLPMAEVHIKHIGHESTEKYRRQLDLNKAEIQWSKQEEGHNYHVRCFMSQPAQILVYRIKGQSIDIEVSLKSVLKHNISQGSNALILSGKAPSKVIPHYWENDDPIKYESEPSKQGMDFGISISAQTESGNIEYLNEKIKIKARGTVILYIAGGTSFNGFKKHPVLQGKDYYLQICKYKDDAREKGFHGLYTEHIKEYQCYYLRNQLEIESQTDINKPLDERLADVKKGTADISLVGLLYNYGRYLLISCSRKCSEPANLQGIWNKEKRPYWSCNYTTNINLEMNYWSAEQCNLSECTEPLLNMIEQLSVDGKKAAKAYYGCKGWTAHHNVDLWRQAIPAGTDVPAYGMSTSIFWCMAGAWLCRHLWDHYLYTGNKIFLSEQCKPLLDGTVDFLLDWIVKDDRGRYTTIPAFSPENSYSNGANGRCSVSEGSAMDQEIITDVFSIYLKMMNEIRCGSDVRINEIEHYLKNLKGIECDAEGKIMEWEKERTPIEPGHRHHSPLYGLYPGEMITEENIELFHGAKQFLDWKIANHSSDFGWSLSWTICLYARLKDKQKVQQEIEKYMKGSLYPNLFSIHPPLSEKEREVFQIDALFGFTAAVAECLLQSQNDKIHILPCLPDNWKNGSILGMKARGGHVIDIFWKDGILERLIIKFGFKTKIELHYSGIVKRVTAKTDEVLVFDRSLTY